jgi:hypothetical protein
LKRQPAKPTAEFDAKWGGTVINAVLFTKLVDAGLSCWWFSLEKTYDVALPNVVSRKLLPNAQQFLKFRPCESAAYGIG